MTTPRIRTVLLVLGTLFVILAAGSPWIVSGFWRVRTSNPVRRGISRAEELGCFHCHGELGRAGIPVPGSDEGVPAWGGGVWMMYVKNEDDIRRFILQGHDEGSEDHDSGPEAIVMPAYEQFINAGELEDLVATFKVLSGMVGPPRGTPARAGFELGRERNCFACHGPAGAGGLPNPGSFTGFIPGWYGAGFRDLVSNRQEFDTWIREGTIPRLSGHPIARFFLNRQRVKMPAYRELGPDQLDALWAYTEWLKESDGGHRGEIATW